MRMVSMVIITGIMADASALGDGEDVTAVVRVNGVPIEHSPVKLADVMTGLNVTVTSADGLQCQVPKTGQGTSQTDGIMATIKVVEGFDEAFATDADNNGAGTSVVVLNFQQHSRGCDRDAFRDGTGVQWQRME